MSKALKPIHPRLCRCGKVFYIYKYRINTALNCSRRCTVLFRVNPTKGKHYINSSLAKLGEKNPMYGLKATETQRLAASKTMIRLWKSEEFRKKVIRRGEANNKWKGGITKPNEKIRKSVEYQQWREEVFKRDNYTCKFCKQTGIYVQADHILRFADYPSLRLNVGNGRTLCKPCHSKVTKLQTGSKVLRRVLV